MAPTELKLTYFDGAGRAEAIRLAFFIGKVPFEDERLSFPEFGKLKPSLPYGQVPILRVDGQVLAQSLAMLRFAGKLTGLYPSNDLLSALMIDEVLAALDELMVPIVASIMEQDEAKRLTMRQELVAKTIPRYLKLMEARIVKMNPFMYFRENKLNILTLAIYGLVLQLKSGRLDHIPTSIVDGYNEIMSMYELVKQHPRVQLWYETQRLNKQPKLRLIYFDAPGRAESTRLAFTIGNVPFEDVRLAREDFATKKPTFPYEQLPVLEINDMQLAQSFAILRYAGQISGLYPQTNAVAALRVDEILMAIEDFYGAAARARHETDPEKKAQLVEVFVRETAPKHLTFINARLVKWACKHAVHDSLTVADLAIYVGVKWLNGEPMPGVTGLAKDYAELMRVFAQVNENPKVQEYYANH